MSKKNGVMDIWFQKWNIIRFIKAFSDVEPDTIDYSAMIDSHLHYPENEILIRKQIGISKNRLDKYK